MIRVDDERVLTAFYFSLFDTLVADTLEQATRIAYGRQRFRVVSLTGDVIEVHGTMTGGGKSQIRGKIGETVKTKTAVKDTSFSGPGGEDIEQMQVKAQDMHSRICYLQQEQGELEKRVGELRQSLRAKETQLKRFSIDVNSYAQQIPLLEQQTEEQRLVMEQTRSDPKKVAELGKLIEEKKKVFEKTPRSLRIKSRSFRRISQPSPMLKSNPSKNRLMICASRLRN